MFGTMYAAGTYPHAIYYLNTLGTCVLGTGLLVTALIPMTIATRRARKKGYRAGFQAGLKDPEAFMLALKKMQDKGIIKELATKAAPATRETELDQLVTPLDT